MRITAPTTTPTLYPTSPATSFALETPFLPTPTEQQADVFFGIGRRRQPQDVAPATTVDPDNILIKREVYEELGRKVTEVEAQYKELEAIKQQGRVWRELAVALAARIGDSDVPVEITDLLPRRLDLLAPPLIPTREDLEARSRALAWLREAVQQMVIEPLSGRVLIDKIDEEIRTELRNANPFSV